VRQGESAAKGVLDYRPEGWFDQGEVPVPADFATTTGRLYGPGTMTTPPYEGSGRIALYESFPADDAYFQSRIDQSRLDGGVPTAVTICGEATEVWSIESTGELIVGWTDRSKSDVLVANTADFTIEQLLESAERVYDCCG
jgi:hypothetical protein